MLFVLLLPLLLPLSPCRNSREDSDRTQQTEMMRRKTATEDDMPTFCLTAGIAENLHSSQRSTDFFYAWWGCENRLGARWTPRRAPNLREKKNSALPVSLNQIIETKLQRVVSSSVWPRLIILTNRTSLPLAAAHQIVVIVEANNSNGNCAKCIPLVAYY